MIVKNLADLSEEQIFSEYKDSIIKFLISERDVADQIQILDKHEQYGRFLSQTMIKTAVEEGLATYPHMTKAGSIKELQKIIDFAKTEILSDMQRRAMIYCMNMALDILKGKKTASQLLADDTIRQIIKG